MLGESLTCDIALLTVGANTYVMLSQPSFSSAHTLGTMPGQPPRDAATASNRLAANPTRAIEVIIRFMVSS